MRAHENFHDIEQGMRNGSTLGDEGGGSSATPTVGNVREIDPTINRGQLGTVQVDDTPGISISDYSCYVSEREIAWRDIFLRNTIDSQTLPKDSTKETMEIICMLKMALIYTKEQSGRVLILHIDHVYDQIILHKRREPTAAKPEIK
jgi:hypothetical protein